MRSHLAPVDELDLADQFWFLAHTVEGVPRLHDRALQYGLAACLVGELILAGWVALTPHPDPFIDDLLLTTLDNRPPPPRGDLAKHGDKAEAELPPLWRQMVRGEPWRHPVPAWLKFMAADASEMVVSRLVTAGHLKLGGRHAAANVNQANGPGARLWSTLTNGRLITDVDAALLAIADAAGLGDYVISDNTTARAYVEWFRQELPIRRPDFAELARHAAAAVAGSVLTRGTASK